MTAVSGRMPFLIGPVIDVCLRFCVIDVNWGSDSRIIFMKIGPFDRDELQPHVVAMGNRVLLRRGDDSLL